MQIAVPTLILLAAIIPGVAFVNAYYAGKFPRELSGLTALDQLVLYVLAATKRYRARGGDSMLVDIPGDRIIPSANGWRRVRYEVEGVLRSVWFEEP